MPAWLRVDGGGEVDTELMDYVLVGRKVNGKLLSVLRGRGRANDRYLVGI